MAFQLIMGTTGTNKTSYVLNEMNKRAKEKASMELFIVPEQYTMEAQQEFIKATKSKGLLNVEVLSFNRLVYRFYDQLALINKKNMSDNGKSLMIRKIIEEHLDDFVWIKKHRKKQSYMEELNTLVSECYQYAIDADTLENFSKKVSDQLLKDKLLDLKTLLFYYHEQMKDEFITGNEAILKLIECIPRIEELKHATVTIDSFYGFTPIQYKIIGALMPVVKELKICITIDSSEKIGDMKNESALFYEAKKMISTLRNLAEQEKIAELEPLVFDEIKRNQKDDLKHITSHLFRYGHNEYPNTSNSIRFMEAVDINTEAKAIALRIHRLIKKNKRFKDIVVLVSDINQYEPAIHKHFKAYDLSYHIDKKESITKQPLVQFILSALLILQYNYRYEHVFYHLKSIYYEQNDKLCLIENYCYQRGIKGSKKWHEIFEEYDEDKLNLMERFFVLETAIKKGKTIGEKIRALYEYMEVMKVYEKHEQLVEVFEKDQNLSSASEYEKIYGLVLDFMDNTVELIGDEEVSVKEFAELMETGLSSVKLAQTPPSVDQILVGDISRSRVKETDYVFVMGVNEGKVPMVVNGNQLLTDRERSTLLELGLEVAPDQGRSLFKEQMNIYMALTKARKLLHVSYARSGEEGTMRPAAVFYSLSKMFKNITVEKASVIIENYTELTREVPMFERLADIASRDDYAAYEESIEKLYGYFAKQYEVRKDLKLNPTVFVDGLNYKNRAEDIPVLKDEGYSLSVSELEAYASCPYAHFLDYRLKLKEREEYLITLPDIGILFHKCLELYIKKCVSRQLDMSHMEADLRNELIESCVEEALTDSRNKIFTNSFRNKYLVVKLTRILKRAVWGIEKQLKKSVFRPKDIEYKFDGKKADMESLVLNVAPNVNMFLKGVVDRVDEYETDDLMYVSIIDYKSSDKSLDFGLIDSGIQLQLFVYLNVVKEIKENSTSKKVIPSGLYYYRIQDPYVKNESKDEEEIESKLLKQLRPKGLVLHDEEVISLFDHTIDGTSEVIPVTYNKKGISNKLSSTITKEQMDTTLKYVVKKSEELGKGIRDGEVEIKPYLYEGRTPCEYCSYKSVCRFDTTNIKEEYRVIKKQSIDDVMPKWEGEV